MLRSARTTAVPKAIFFMGAPIPALIEGGGYEGRPGRTSAEKPHSTPDFALQTCMPDTALRISVYGAAMRVIAPIAAIAGLALITGLIAYYGFASVLVAVVSSKWGTALVIAARAAALAMAGAG